MTQTYKKKLIEVAIPLEAINAASAREKSIRHGHPSTLHLWWARRPLAACRAVLFAQLVDDPSSLPDEFPTPEAQEAERKRLFGIIEDLVKWENSTNEEVLERARAEIRRSCGGELPPVYDPFSGGGSIPLEAQRLGLPAYGSDLNPVAVMIGKAMIEIPPKFKDMEPIHPGLKDRNHYRHAEGLAEDVKYYGEWMREKALERIGRLYPQVDLPKELGGGKATVISWIWARTVESPNPALGGAHVPLFKSAWISTKGSNKAWVDVLTDRINKSFDFQVRTSGEPTIATTVKRTAAICALSGDTIPLDYIQKKGKEGKLGERQMAIVCEGSGKRYFISPDKEAEAATPAVDPEGAPSCSIDHWRSCTNCVVYGFDDFGKLFTPRQHTALVTFSDLVSEVHEEALQRAREAGLNDNDPSLEAGGRGAEAYADAIALYMSIAVNRLADRCSSFCGWDASHNKIRNTFSRQAIPMVWEYAEVNPFSNSTGNWSSCVEWIFKVIADLRQDSVGFITQESAVDLSYRGVPLVLGSGLIANK